MNHYNCIYMYVNKINGKIYIGQTKNFIKRHKRHMKKSQDKCLFDRELKEYGENNFDIFILKENIPTRCLLNLFECYYIEKYKTLTNNNLYNVSSGGHYMENPFANKTEEEMKIIGEKISKNHKDCSGESNPMYNKKGKNHPKSKFTMCHNLDNTIIEFYESQTEASEKTGVGRRDISACCNGKQKSAGKFPNGEKRYWKKI